MTGWTKECDAIGATWDNIIWHNCSDYLAAWMKKILQKWRAQTIMHNMRRIFEVFTSFRHNCCRKCWISEISLMLLKCGTLESVVHKYASSVHLNNTNEIIFFLNCVFTNFVQQWFEKSNRDVYPVWLCNRTFYCQWWNVWMNVSFSIFEWHCYCYTQATIQANEHELLLLNMVA